LKLIYSQDHQKEIKFKSTALPEEAASQARVEISDQQDTGAVTEL